MSADEKRDLHHVIGRLASAALLLEKLRETNKENDRLRCAAIEIKHALRRLELAEIEA